MWIMSKSLALLQWVHSDGIADMPVLPGRGTFRHQRLSAYKCLGEFRPLNPGDSPSVSARPTGGRPSSAQSLSLPGVRRNEGFQHGLAHEVGRQQPLTQSGSHILSVGW